MSSESNTVTRPFSEVVAGIAVQESTGYLVDAITPDYAVKPASLEELTDIIRSARADGLSIIPWGGGSQMGVGNLPSKYDVAVDLRDLNQVLRYDADDMTMSVQTGCRMQELNDMLNEHRQVLPVDTAFPERATIGGVTAVGASGPRRLGYGPLRDLIIGMSVVSADGVVSKAGGNVVKNVTGFDMMRLHHGALGSLGIIVSINLKVIPKPQSERTVIATYQSLDDADRAARAVVQSQLGVTALVVTNPAATAEATGVTDGLWALAVRCEAPPSAVVRQAERVSGFVSEGAVAVQIEDSTAESEARWAAICQALDQRPDSPDIGVRIGLVASKIVSVGEALAHDLEGFGSPRMTLDYGSGLAYVRVGRDEISSENHSEFVNSISEHSEHMTLLTGPTALKETLDVFGGPVAGFNMIESLKATFDPDGTLNPGRYIGRL